MKSRILPCLLACLCLACLAGSALASCTGTCTACSSFVAQAACSAQSGCSWVSTGCTGTPNACSTYTNRTDCASHGCHWHTSPRRCGGAPGDCSTYDTQNDCASGGCTWNASCTGTCTTCSTLGTQTACNAQAGCSWVSAVCGNNIIEPGEVCDGSSLGGQTCITRGFTGGTLSCSANCLSFNTSGCTSITCGNNIAEAGEVCDGSDLSGETCVSRGFLGGTLACSADCASFNTSACTSATCGNNIKEGSEACDGTDLAGQTCVTRGFASGILSCSANCASFNTSRCVSAAFCGNDAKEGNETCDGIDLAGSTCVGLGYAGGILACEIDCLSFDTSSCISSVCGNSIRETGEVCDGHDLGSRTCVSQGYDAGTLSCVPDCSAFNATNCSGTGPVCGNGVKEGNEVCDGSDLVGNSCASRGYISGTLRCSLGCLSFDTSGCTGGAGGCAENCCGNHKCEELNGEDFASCTVDCTTPKNLYFTFYSPLENEVFARGEMVLIKVGLKADSAVPPAKTVEWVKASCEGVFGAMALFDDGQHDDGRAGDGIFAKSFLVTETIEKGLKELVVEAKVAATTQGTKRLFTIDPVIGIGLSTEKSTYSLGDLLGIGGSVRRGGSAAKLPVLLRVSSGGGILFDWNGSSREDGFFQTSYQTTAASPEGEWLVSVYSGDEFGNSGSASETVKFFKPKPFSALSISLLGQPKDSFQRGEQVKFTVAVLDEYGEFVKNAEVVLLLPGGRQVGLALGTGKFYTGTITIPWDLPLGRQAFLVSAVEKTSYRTQQGNADFSFSIEPAQIKIELLEPKNTEFSAGDDMPLRVRLTYPSGDPVVVPTITVLVGKTPVELVAVGKGIYAGAYSPGLLDSGRLPISVQAQDQFDNLGSEEYSFSVSGISRLYWAKNFPVTISVFALVILVAMLISSVVVSKRKSIARLLKKRAKLEAKQKECQYRYELNAIDGETYNKMRAKFDSELARINQAIKELEAELEGTNKTLRALWAKRREKS